MGIFDTAILFFDHNLQGYGFWELYYFNDEIK